MANRSYCRFENTLEDLKGCAEHILDDDLSEEEAAARKRLIKTCREIAAEAEAEDEGGVKTELSAADIKKYIEDGGCSCPFCGDEFIAGDDVTTGGGEASQEMSCSNCGAQWNDCYDLVGIEITEAPKGDN